MDLQDLGSLGEFVAAIATIVTLAYLAVQIRQNTESVRMSAELDVSQQTAEFAARVRSQPEIVRIWDLAASDPSSLTEIEVAQFRWVLAEMFGLFEGQYQIYKKGYISETSWIAKANLLRGVLASPVALEWWRERMCPLSDEFFEYIDSGVAEGASPWKFRRIGEVTGKHGESAPDNRMETDT